jgi:hypothetical protein
MFLTLRELAAAARRQMDFDQLMQELSGFTAGRIPRFLRPEQIERIRQAAGLSAGTSLSERGRRYIELMEDLSRRLAAINRALDRAMERSRQRLQETRAVLDDIRARASLSEDGRRVYRTEDRQRAFYDDGTELTREEIAKVHWRDGAPIPVRLQGADHLGRARAPIIPVEDAGGFLVVARSGQAIGQGFNRAVQIGGALVSVQAIEEVGGDHGLNSRRED